MTAHVRLRDLCDVDFSPGMPLLPVAIEGAPRLFAPHEVEQMQAGLRSGLLTRRAMFVGLGGIAALTSLLLSPRFAFAANTTAWTGGTLNSGLGWVNAISTGGVATLANGNSILDGTDQTNGTGLDIFADLSFSITIASSTIVAGANTVYYNYYLNQDGTTYGDNHLTTTAAAVTSTLFPVATPACFAAAAQTSIIGNWTGIVLAPGTFRWAMQNNCGFTFTAATIKYRSYNTNLNR